MQKIVYVFDCPVHGEESQVFCFRVADPALISRWRRYELTWKELPVDREGLKEIYEIQAQFMGPRKGM